METGHTSEKKLKGVSYRLVEFFELMMSKHFLLTGGTGAIGSALIPELIERGHRVTCLVRAKHGRSGLDRLGQIGRLPGVGVIEGDISLPNCGVISPLRGGFDALLHAAADTRLDHRDAEGRIAINHAGTVNTLALATALDVPEFHYVGTAYVAGDANSLQEQSASEALSVGKPRNPYESSKADAERAVRVWRGRTSIYRPSIVVGRDDTGETHGLHGLYAVAKAIWRLHSTVCSGAYRDALGRRITTATPLTVSPGILQESQSLNLVPLDWLAKTLTALASETASGRCYNLVHGEDTRVSVVIAGCFEALGMSNVVFGEKPALALAPIMKGINRAVKIELERFGPYLAGRTRFKAENVFADLGDSWPRPPAISQDFIRKTVVTAHGQWLKEATLRMPWLQES